MAYTIEELDEILSGNDLINGTIPRQLRDALKTIERVQALPRVAVLGGKEKRVLYGSSAKSATTGEASALYVRADELQQALEQE